MKLKPLLFAGLLTLMPGVIVPAAAAGTIVVQNQRYLSVHDIASRYGMKVFKLGERAILFDTNRQVQIIPNKRYILIGGIRYSTGFLPQLRNRTLYMSQLDMLTLLDPVLGKRSIKKHAIRTIVIDPGHGGKDQGAAGKKLLEKKVTLELARKLQFLLRRAGYHVVLTRDGDYTLPLAKRSIIAKNQRADLFISLHINATSDKSVSGLETYLLTPSGAPSSNSQRPVEARYVGNRNDNNNMALAHQIHRYMLAKTGNLDRGVKRARFQVLRDISAPAVLVEAGFVSNAKDEWRLGSSQYQDAIARGIADGVLQYHRSLLKLK